MYVYHEAYSDFGSFLNMLTNSEALLIMKEIDEVLKKVKRVHFIGIGGSGMCPLVEILHSKGYEITGSGQQRRATSPAASVRSVYP